VTFKVLLCTLTTLCEIFVCPSHQDDVYWTVVLRKEGLFIGAPGGPFVIAPKDEGAFFFHGVSLSEKVVLNTDFNGSQYSKAMTFERVGVVGSGTMGLGIAIECARVGFDVTLRSRADPQNCQSRVDRVLSRLVERDEMTPSERAEISSRFRTVMNLELLEDRDIVIECVVEEARVKIELMGELDYILGGQVPIATNTSTFSVLELAGVTTRPDRVVGLHFFNPVARMLLVEVVKTLVVDQGVLEGACELVARMGKQPVVVADTPGFVVNALLFPYLNSAVRLKETRVASAQDIDRCMVLGCRFPMGPLALIDLVGVDVTVAILEELHRGSGDPACVPAVTLKRMLAAGWLGRKAGKGFYDYELPSS